MPEPADNHVFRLRVWGRNACFTRPEMKVDRVSYDVITPSAARGIIEAIYWKPQIAWHVERIHVLAPIARQKVRRNETVSPPSLDAVGRDLHNGTTPRINIRAHRTQRDALVLRDVDYVIEARFSLTERADPPYNPVKHADTFRRRASRGQCFRQPVLGCREFPAAFRLLEPGEPTPAASHAGEQSLGWMLYDFDFANDRRPVFYQPVMRDGVIEVSRHAAEHTAS